MIGIGIGLNRQLFAGGFANAYNTRVLADGGTIEATPCVNAASTLLQSASLLLIPSGYKSGVAYSQLPNNGNGDLTWTRASTANRTNSSGLIESVASGVPRLSYMYGSCPALLLEPQRTNSIRNSTMQGASTSPSTLPTNWTSAGSGLSRSVVEIGIINGVNYIDVRIFGTATNVFYDVFTEVATQISASQNQVWTNSCYLQFINTTNPPLSTNLAMREFSSVGGFLGVYTGANLSVSSLSIQRFVQTKTIVNATCAFVQPSVFFNLTNGATYDFTIRIAAPQMELGAYATTWINTTSATATRVADSFSRNNIYTNGLITSSGGTWYMELKNNVSYVRDSATSFGIGDTTSLNTNSIIFLPSTTSRHIVRKYLAGVSSILYTTATDNAKIAVKWNGTTADVFVNGVKQVSSTVFTATALEFIGFASSSGLGIPTFIQQMALFSTPLSDSDCVSLTT